MGKHNKSQESKLAGGVMLGALASGALAIGAVSSAGTASATCASIDGIGNGTSGGSTCTSSAGSFAVATGQNADASSTGLFSGAVANGFTNGPTDFTEASSTGNFDFAYAQGPNTVAASYGTAALAVAAGSNNVAEAGNSTSDVGNVAINLSNNTNGFPATDVVDAGGNSVLGQSGSGNIAANLGGVPTYVSGPVGPNNNPLLVEAIGKGNAAFNVLGNGNTVEAGSLGTTSSTYGIGFNPGTSTGALAFSGPGHDNGVQALGPGAVAGALISSNNNFYPGQVGNVQQSGPGVHVIP